MPTDPRGARTRACRVETRLDATLRPISRRAFLSAALVGLPAKGERRITGGFVNDSFQLGHALRDRKLTPGSQTRTEKVDVVIVGAGIAGLSAAWRLDKRGFRDFVLLEMEQQIGGNSRWGENEFTPYPWAAHYVPVPNKNSLLVRELMEELGVLNNGQWEERYLCFTPQERLFIHGRWQEGVEPELAASKRDREQGRRFDGLIAELKSSGEFTIPIRQPRKTAGLDRMAMRDWLVRNGIDSPYVHWHVDYACRDDYGAKAADTSAWAGVHYFASREHEDNGPLTWPEGNGWIARRLADRLKDRIRTGQPVIHIGKDRATVFVHTPKVVYTASRVIFAAPTFLAKYVIEGAPAFPLVYSPWITANLTLDRLPDEKNSYRAWDNVIYGSPSLGYVDATHMGLQSRSDRTVWTYYYALAEGSPAQNRRMLLEKDWAYWRDVILNDLNRAHPDIRECVSRIDVMRMGHAMARPAPGTMSHPSRLAFGDTSGPIVYGNSDLSGLSIFEEAQYRGVRAADAVLKSL